MNVNTIASSLCCSLGQLTESGNLLNRGHDQRAKLSDIR